MLTRSLLSLRSTLTKICLWVLPGAIIVVGSSCRVPVTQKDIDAAIYPPQPTLENAEAQIRGHFEMILKDPASLRLEIEDKRFRKGWARQFIGEAPLFGWILGCTANAKNSFGGYTGAKPYLFVFSTDGLYAFNHSWPIHPAYLRYLD